MQKSGNLFWGILSKTIVGLCLAVMMHTGGAFAVIDFANSCIQMSASTCFNYGATPAQQNHIETGPNGTYSIPGCASPVQQCWETVRGTYVWWYTCDRCESGYIKTEATGTMVGCGNPTYYYCVQNCPSCNNCVSDTTWSSAGTGYQSKVTRTCDCGICNSTTTYRCAAGYYPAASGGRPTAGSKSALGCTPCPSNSTCTAGSSDFTCKAGYYQNGTACTSCVTTCGAGHTSPAGATSETQCRAAANTTYSDGTGTFQYETACCCSGTCDSMCDSGKFCTSNSDCDSGTCLDNCCQEINLCGFLPTCTSDADCNQFQTCDLLTGCCTLATYPGLPSNPGLLICDLDSDLYCRTSNDCDFGYTCNSNSCCVKEEVWPK